MSELPKTGLKPAKMRRVLEDAKKQDANWEEGRTWSLVYHAGEEHMDSLLEVYRMFFATNGLSPAAFPSLGRFERDVVSIMANLLGGGDTAAGTMTSGGTESILLAVKAHRDWFKKKNKRVRRPQVVIPASAHPAFYKAAHYFEVEPVTVNVNSFFRLDADEVAKAITGRTALLVASAPSYPYGMVDPVRELGELALQHGTGLHVDACLGGAFLPFLSKLGHKVPSFDFSVPGVTSISADLHKYGFATKGTSVVLYKDAAFRRHQFFAKPDWLGGAYASPAMLGTRPGGGIASAWASLMMLGESGYLKMVKKTLALRDQLFAGLKSAGFELVGKPDMTVFCFTSKTGDIFAVASELEKRGWRIDRQKNPPSIHMIVTQNHQKSAAQFVRDLKVIARKQPKFKRDASHDESISLYGVTNNFAGGTNPVEALYRAIESIYD